MPEVETLAVHCAQCGEPVTLHYTPDGPEGLPDTKHWECPHCQRPNGIQMAGTILAAVVGHGQPM
jgi:DNA-directed RNA polymerase subunit RPC12/RpoP